MKFIDSLANLGLPRYLSAEELLHVMDDNEVEAAVVSATPACADLGELSRATVRYGDRLRVVGEPVGRTSQERADSVSAQLASGFFGIHLSDRRVVEEPELLDLIGHAGAAAFVTGSSGLGIAASSLLSFLERHDNTLVCAPAFGGIGDPEILATDPWVMALFGHPRFLVIFSGQGAYEDQAVKRWARAVIEGVGWERVLWGSDFPQCLWRGESYLSTTVWIDKIGLSPSDSDRQAFFLRNARQYLFGRTLPKPQPLAERWCRSMQEERPLPVSLFPS